MSPENDHDILAITKFTLRKIIVKFLIWKRHKFVCNLSAVLEKGSKEVSTIMNKKLIWTLGEKLYA